MVLSQSNSRSGPVDVASLIPGWSDRGTGSLARRLAHAIRNGIESGLIGDGVRLPPERSLRRLPGHQSLDRRDRTRRAPVRWSGRVPAGQRDDRGRPRIAGRGRKSHRRALRRLDRDRPGRRQPTRRLPPAAGVHRRGRPGRDRRGPRGPTARAHRTAVRRWRTDSPNRGRLTDIDQVHITVGAHQAVSVAIRSLLRPGGVLATEDPSYPGIFDIADGVSARVAPVRSDSEGLIPADLERVLSEDRPAVLYMQTGPHNPLGHVTGPGSPPGARGDPRSPLHPGHRGHDVGRPHLRRSGRTGARRPVPCHDGDRSGYPCRRSCGVA